MILGPVIYSLLSADPGVSGLVADRIFPEVLPQEPTLPAVVYTVVDDVPVHSLQGCTAGTSNARVQIDTYAKTYVTAQTVAEAIAAALQSYVGPDATAMLLSRRDEYEDDPAEYRVSLDFSMWTKGS